MLSTSLPLLRRSLSLSLPPSLSLSLHTAAGIPVPEVAGVVLRAHGAERERLQALLDTEIFPTSVWRLIASSHRLFHSSRLSLLRERRSLYLSPSFSPLSAFAETQTPGEREREIDIELPGYLRERLVDSVCDATWPHLEEARRGASNGIMVDFDDALSPSLSNVISAHAGVARALAEETAERGARRRPVLIPRPRPLHVDEVHVEVDGERVSAALFDTIVTGHHMLQRYGGFAQWYLVKLERGAEAKWWADVLRWLAGEEGWVLKSPSNLLVTVLIETLPASFHLHEILSHLHRHAFALNTGKFDYAFSFLKRCLYANPLAGAHTDLGGNPLAGRVLTMPLPQIVPDGGAGMWLREWMCAVETVARERGVLFTGGMAGTYNPALAGAVAAEKAVERRTHHTHGTLVAQPQIAGTVRTLLHRMQTSEKSANPNIKNPTPGLTGTAAASSDSAKSADPSRMNPTPGLAVAEKSADAMSAYTREGLVSICGELPAFVPARAVADAARLSLRYWDHWAGGGRGWIVDVGFSGGVQDSATAEGHRQQLHHWVHGGAVSLDQACSALEAEARTYGLRPEVCTTLCKVLEDPQLTEWMMDALTPIADGTRTSTPLD